MSTLPDVTVLFVDDEKVNLFIYQKQFQHSFKTLTAQSPNEGLDLLDSHHSEIIVVFSDMRMPVMNGVEFIRKAKSKYDNIYYFILTAFDYDDDIQQALDESLIEQCLQKPFNKNQIINLVRDAAQKGKN